MGASYRNSRRALAVNMFHTRLAVDWARPPLWGAVCVGFQRDDADIFGGLVIVDVDDRKAYRQMAFAFAA